nr:prominin-1-A [Onthophagus taurus]
MFDGLVRNGNMELEGKQGGGRDPKEILIVEQGDTKICSERGVEPGEDEARNNRKAMKYERLIVSVASCHKVFTKQLQMHPYKVTIVHRLQALDYDRRVTKLETLVLFFITIWFILSISLPIAIITQLCFSKTSTTSTGNDGSQQHHRLLALFLYTTLTILVTCILLMLASNDKLTKSVEKLPYTTGLIVTDLETFVENTHLQMNFATGVAFEKVFDRIEQDLKDVDKLLGEDFLNDLEVETNLKSTIEGLVDLKTRSAGISVRVSELAWECSLARKSTKALQEALDELSAQINSARKFCHQKDRSLCETIHPTGLSLTLNVEEIIADPMLSYFERMRHNSDFNATIEATVKTYDDVLKTVVVETGSERAAAYDCLQKHRRIVYGSLRSLEELSTFLINNLKEKSKKLIDWLDVVVEKELWRNISILGISFLIVIIWTAFLCGSPCECSVLTKTGPILSFGITLLSFTILILWFFGSITFLIGGHGQNFICNSFYDDHYDVLTKIFDENGLIYDQGFFKEILNSNETLKIENILKGCEKNQSSYTTFHLENRLDLTKIFNFKTWGDFKSVLETLTFDTNKIKFKSNDLETILKEFNQFENLKRLRSKVSLPVTHRELFTFKQQIFSVVKQIENTKTANNFEAILLKLEEIIQKEYQVVNNFRDNVLYKLTSIEILYEPLREKSKIFLSALDRIEDVLNEKGVEIIEKNVKKYKFRFEKYLNELHRFSNEQVRRKTARCRPFWDIFDFVRIQTCSNLIDSLNALSCSFFFITILFIVITPAIIHLIKKYNKIIEAEYLQRSTYRRYSTSSNPEDTVWVTPESSSSDQRYIEDRSSASIIPIPPSPPRPPSLPKLQHDSITTSTVSSTSTSEDVKKQIPKKTMTNMFAKRRLKPKQKQTLSRYDSLKQIEKTSKSPRPGQGLAPRGWL